jgi:biotin synthase-related radical SAM superfamily protein
MKVPPVKAIKKASLLESNWIYVPPHERLGILERATAGCDAGLRSIFIKFGNYRVRMAITKSPEKTSFSLERIDDKFCVKLNDAIFLGEVVVERALFHTLNQVFINLSSPCIFDCKFCATPKLKVKFVMKPQKVLDIIKSAMKKEEIHGIALTCSVLGPEELMVNWLIDIVKLIRRELGVDLPIGVEPYITQEDYVEDLYSAGADELKVNIECFDEGVFRAVCPEKNHSKIFRVLSRAAEVFGKNRVCSNVIIGLGESEGALLNGLEHMAEIGILVNLRPLFISPLREKELKIVTGGKASRPKASTLLKLALKYRDVLERYNLRTTYFKTMCFKCTGCEIVPQQDV